MILSPTDVQRIIASRGSATNLARKFGVSPAYIHILRRQGRDKEVIRPKFIKFKGRNCEATDYGMLLVPGVEKISVNGEKIDALVHRPPTWGEALGGRAF